MEETKHNEQPEKLSYEKLQEIVAELELRNSRLVEEYKKLRAFVTEQQTQSIFAYLNAAERVIEHYELFSTDFIGVLTKDIEKIMYKLREIIVPEDEEEDEQHGERTQTA